ncbi:MAG TPA: hypothetical protein VFT28_00320, partial [Gemmatimonadales bacterium]|nr:hypothetical protein [Gemmatimonadales bacterium]
FVTRLIPTFASLTTAMTAAACSSEARLPSDPNEGGSSASAVATVDSALGSGSVSRIEIELFPGELVAREVHVEADNAEEKIVSGVTAIDPAQGALTLELGGLVVNYGAGTRFRTESESHESRETWEALVQGEIAAGRHPTVEARRNPAGAPQSPDDPSFSATDLRLQGEADEPKIEIYVDGDNLAGADGASEVILKVLGLSITVNGRTRLGPDDNGGAEQPSGGSVEFEMGVAAADAAGGTLTLSNGTVVRVTAATTIDPEGDLLTLEAAAAAVAGASAVRAEGRGSVESSASPVEIVASSLKIEVDD